MIGILVTDGGAHSPDKWAEATASHIVDIADHVAGERRGAAIKLQAAIIDILTAHHGHCQNGERAMIGRHGCERFTRDLNPDGHLEFEGVTGGIDGTIAAIIDAAAGTPWESDFQNPDMPIHLRTLLESHFKTNMNIERQWHADRNIDDPAAQTFLAMHNVLEG